MDSHTGTAAPTASLPSWTRPRGRETGEGDAAFSAGITLKSLNDLVRAEPAWAGCWRACQALKCAAAAVRMTGRSEDAAALRDAVLLTVAGGDPGPAGNMLLTYKRLAARKPGFSAKQAEDLAELMGSPSMISLPPSRNWQTPRCSPAASLNSN